MNLTKEFLQQELSARTQLRDKLLGDLNATVGSMATLSQLLAKLDEPEPPPVTDTPSTPT